MVLFQLNASLQPHIADYSAVHMAFSVRPFLHYENFLEFYQLRSKLDSLSVVLFANLDSFNFETDVPLGKVFNRHRQQCDDFMRSLVNYKENVILKILLAIYVEHHRHTTFLLSNSNECSIPFVPASVGCGKHIPSFASLMRINFRHIVTGKPCDRKISSKMLKCFRST